MTRKAALATTTLLFTMSAIYMAACGDDESPSTPGGTDGGADVTLQDSSSSTDGNGGNDTGSQPADAGEDVQLLGDTGSNITVIVPGGDAAALNCGTANCGLPSETCCIYPVTSGVPPYYGACSNGNSCPALSPDASVGPTKKATELQCEVPENCVTPGQVCCIQGPQSGSGGGGKITSHCTAAGACVTQVTPIDAGPDADAGFTVSPRAVMCNPLALDAGCQAVDAGGCSGTNIGTWNLPTGFGTCGGIAR